jgi:hypothetical protein
MNLFTRLNEESDKQKQQLEPPKNTVASPQTSTPTTDAETTPGTAPAHARDRTQKSTQSRHPSRDLPRGNSRNLPTRHDIQYFNFDLKVNDQLKATAKAQADLPLEWIEELESLTQSMKVGKLELYRFIFGQFLGKVEKTGKG